MDFATDDPSTSMNLRARRYQVVRGFCEYLATFEPRTPTLGPKALPRPRNRPVRHIIGDDELALLLREARHVSKRHPVRGITLDTIIGLAASTGLRISELVRLDKADVARIKNESPVFTGEKSLRRARAETGPHPDLGDWVN